METAIPAPAKETPDRALQSSGAAAPGESAGGRFEIDVFISFTHIDNAPLMPGEDGWITNLHHALGVRLPQLIGGEVRIWRDPKLNGNDYIGDTLIDKLSRTAVMIAVLSPRYVRSDWCQLEVETFARCCERDPCQQPRNKSRVFKVIKTPVPYEQQPAELKDLLGYEFFELAADNQRPKEFRQDVGHHKDQRYWDRLEDLAYEVSELVTALRSEGTVPDANADKSPVYLAATSSDLSNEFDLVRRELQQRGYPVLPDRPLPTIASELREAVAGYLERSRLAVHLVGRRYGLVPEGTELSLTELQNDVAAESAGKRGLQRVIWMPPGLEPEDARQREFIHRLETDSAAQTNADLLRTELGELKRVVLNLLEPPAPTPAGDSGSALPRDVYLMYAPEDFEAAAPLEDALFNAGCELLTPLIDAAGREDPEEHRANLAECEAALVLYANASEQWLRERLRELEQATSAIPRGVYLGAPETPRKLRFRTHRAAVIKQFGDFDPVDLKPFFAEFEPVFDRVEMMNDGLDLSNPFPGLRSFSATESDRFFGREDQIGEVLRRLRRHRFLAVIGASGSGKSSLIRAGVIPCLGRRLRTRSGTDWGIAIMTPGNAPIAHLAEALAAPRALGGADLEPTLRRSLLEATLRRGALGLIQAVREARSGNNLLLLVDQFEELFRVRPPAGESQNEATAFIRLVLEASAQQEVPIYVLLTMRSDFLGDCVRFQGLPEAINRGQYLIPDLTREQRRAVITDPVRLRGAQIAPRLVNRLLNDVGEDSSQLTSLQHALMRTWAYWREHREGDEPLDLAHYESIGTLEHALEQHANEAWKELREKHQRRIAESIFKRLTEKGPDRREVRHPTTLGDLCAITEQPSDAVLKVIDVFRRQDRCFLLPGPETPLDEGSVLDIAHESLIRVWGQLRRWAEEEAQSAEEYLHLVERMTRYQAGKDTHLQNPALRLALDWREHNHPNPAWAARYERRFDAAMGFLGESEAAHHRAQSEQEAARRRELEQARALATEQERRFQEQRRAAQRLRLLALVLILVFAGAMAAAIDAWVSSRQAAQQARQSMARGQAMAAVNNLNVDPERSVLLALQAVATTYQVDGQVMPVAFSALNRAVQATAARPVLKGHSRSVLALAFADESGLLVSAGRDDEVLISDPATRRITASFSFPGAGIGVLAVSADGARLAAAGKDGSIHLWSALEQTPHTLAGHAGGISALTFSPDSQLLASAGEDGTVRLWDAGSGAPIQTMEGHAGRVSALAYRPDGERLASAGWDGTVRLWAPADGTAQRLLQGHTGELTALTYSPDGSRLASAGWDSRVILWDGWSGALVNVLSHADAVLALAFSPDNRWLASGGRDTGVRVWNVGDGQPHNTLVGQPGSILALAFDPAGTLLASAAADGGIYLWNPDTGRRIAVLSGHRDWVNAMTFSGDGMLLASGGDDGRVIIWHLDPAKQGMPQLAGFDPWQARYAVSSDSDGTRVAFLDQGVVKILDPASGRILQVLSGSDPWSYWLAFSTDGRQLATAAEDGKARVYYLDLRELIRRAMDLTTRELTSEECRTFLFRDGCPPGEFPGPADNPQTFRRGEAQPE